MKIHPLTLLSLPQKNRANHCLNSSRDYELGTYQNYQIEYTTWSKMMGGNGISGTIRAMPQNYYVASIDTKGEISFEELEVCTKSFCKATIKELWKTFKANAK